MSNQKFPGVAGTVISNTRVKLSDDFMEYLSGIATRRLSENCQWGTRDKWPVEVGRRLPTDIEGIYGEGAVHVLTGIPLNDGSVRSADLGHCTEVRQTRHKSGRLPYGYKSDKPDHFYFLAIGTGAEFHIPGYIKGSRAMEVGAWMTDWQFPCWAIEQHQLTPWKGYYQ